MKWLQVLNKMWRSSEIKLCDYVFVWQRKNNKVICFVFFSITWLMTSCIDCSRMPRAWSGLQESNKKTLLSRLSEAWMGSANHRKQRVCYVMVKWRITLLFAEFQYLEHRVWISVWAVDIPGGQVLNFNPESTGCSSLSMRPRERRRGEKMTGRLVWTCTGCTTLYGIKCSSWPEGTGTHEGTHTENWYYTDLVFLGKYYG